MESALTELSLLGEELVKCGEIVLSPKKNLFAFNCVHCQEVFSQFIVFVRHIRMEHELVGEEAEQDQQHLQNLSVYTVEELLTDGTNTGLSNSSSAIEQVTEENVTGPNPDSDDTGINSDEELEKEISKLLAGIATRDSHSVNEAEYSDDSGVDSKNITDQNRNQSNLADQTEGKGKQETKITNKRDHSTESEKRHVIAEVNELAGIQFSKEKTDQIKAGIPEVPVCNFQERANIEFEKPEIPTLSGYQREYIVYNEANQQTPITETLTIQDENFIPETTNFTIPLELSLNKSVSSSDIQSEEISELIANDDTECKITKDIISEVENLLAQQHATSFECNDLLISDSTNNHQLPSFAKFFKRSVNAMKISNGLLAQSTPKQKHANVSNENKYTKTSSPLRPSAQLNMNANALVDNPENNTHSNHVLEKTIKCPILKRPLISNEKEDGTKKTKIENGTNRQVNLKTEYCMKKEGLEILSVEVLPPNSTNVDKLKLGELKNLKPSKQSKHICKWEQTTTATIEKDLIPYVKIRNSNYKQPECTSHVAADSTSEKLMTSTNELNYTPEDTLNQLKLEQFINEKPLIDLRDDFNTTDPLNSDSLLASLIEENSFANESVLSGASEEENDNYQLLRPLGLQIIINSNVEDGRNLKKFETMRTQASLFAKIFAEFKYLWKVGNGIKSFEQLELDFNKLMQRINEHYKLELTIAETKHIVNLIALWYMKSYEKCLIKKKPTEESVYHYINLFKYLPKTARRIFYCEECPRYFLAQQKYIAHRAKHAEMPISCPYCQTTYATRKELLLHTKICSTFTCFECDSKFESAADLEYHLRKKHIWRCETCGKLCATAFDLSWHDHQYPIICALCNNVFDSAAELQKHCENSFHWDYTCPICEVFLPTATLMQHHLSICNSDADKKGANS